MMTTWYRFRLLRAILGLPVGETWAGPPIYAAPLRRWAWVPFGTWVYWIPAMGGSLEEARAFAWEKLAR